MTAGNGGMIGEANRIQSMERPGAVERDVTNQQPDSMDVLPPQEKL